MNTCGYAQKILNEVKKKVVGKDRVLKLVLSAFLAKGHVLIEDIPGLGKTTMAVAFEKAIGLTEKRVQFTPDVLPSDILGFSAMNAVTGQMEFRPGAVFCNIFLADEINRTSPKTQSALLEAMEEKQVSVDGKTYPLEDPFFVIATENPTGSIGTQKLPESEMDRFMISVSMGYPTISEEAEILKRKSLDSADAKTVASRDILLSMQQEVSDIYVHDAIYDYLARLVSSTRNHPYIELGGSPRATVSLMNMAKATACLEGRNYVLPEDVSAVFIPCLSHRIIRSRKARIEKIGEEAVLRGILDKERKPTQKNRI